MEYSIKNLAKIAGVSTRTLRYYDEIGLLKPCRINSAGYRIYGENEVNILQQILLYKQLELPLDQIKQILLNKDFDFKKALYDHKKNIIKRQEELNRLLVNVEKTICSLEGGISMSAEEKFEGIKKKLIDENERKYGKEIREKYGDEKVNESYNNFSKLSKDQFEEAERIGKEVNSILKIAMECGDPKGEKAQEAVKLHKKWLSYFGNYPKEAHLGLAQMYVYDSRFKEFYEKNAGQGAAEFLRDSIDAYYNNL